MAICIPGAVMDEIISRPFSKRQQNIILLIARLTYGLNTEWAQIKNKKVAAEAVKIHWVDFYKDFKQLKEWNVIQERQKYARINENPLTWAVNAGSPQTENEALNRLIEHVSENKYKKCTVHENLGETPKKIEKTKGGRGYAAITPDRKHRGSVKTSAAYGGLEWEHDERRARYS